MLVFLKAQFRYLLHFIFLSSLGVAVGGKGFASENPHQLVAASAKMAAEYFHHKGIYDVIVSGGSGVISFYLLSMAWSHLFPNEPLTIYHISPADNPSLYGKSGVPNRGVSLLEQMISNNHLTGKALGYLDDIVISGYKHHALRSTFQALHLGSNIVFLCRMSDHMAEERKCSRILEHEDGPRPGGP